MDGVGGCILTENEKALLTYMYTFSGLNELASVEKIKADTGLPESSVYRSLKSLSEMGLLWRMDSRYRQLKKSSESPKGGPIPGGYACRKDSMGTRSNA